MWDRGLIWAYVSEGDHLTLSMKDEKAGTVTWRRADEPKEAAKTREIDLSKGPWTGDLEISKPGLYRVQVDAEFFRLDAPAHWVVDVGQDLRGDEQLRMMANGDPWYFYVPQDTEGFVIAASSLGPRTVSATVRDAAGNVVRELQADDSTRWTLEAPRDKTGQVWSIGLKTLRLQSLQLWGVPPYLATSPDKLLTPAEALKLKQTQQAQ